MDTVTQIQTLDETFCTLHISNIFGKNMHTTILSPAIGKFQGRLGSLTLLLQPVLEKENSVQVHIKDVYFSFF